MNRIEVNVATGEQTVIPLTQDEIDDAVVRTAAEIPVLRRAAILERLSKLDKLSVRSLRAHKTGRGNAQDTIALDDYETEAVALRLELADL